VAVEPRKRPREPPGPVPTLGQLHDAYGPKWPWLYCQSPG